MSFVQSSFLAFFALVVVAYWGLGRLGSGRRGVVLQNAWLLLASAVFYGWVHPWFLLLLWGSTLLDYGVAQGMVRWPQARGRLLLLSLAGNLGLLATFKYLGFFTANVVAVLDALGLQHGVGVVELFLPVGISFYTFQTMGYSIDVYRGRVEPERDLLNYALYVGLFCQLVAGPVERAGDLLPQVRNPRRFELERLRSGLGLAVWGAVKKLCIADTIAPFVDRAFAVEHPSLLLLLTGGVAFSLQILADFSGYTDIARGTARMLGFELRANFLHPYLAANPRELWRRWHVSFSTWIRDYLYIPMGGSRGPWWRVTAVTAATMLLAGLWHGASWNFVAWGAFHAALLVGHRAWRRLVPGAASWPGWTRVPAVVAMYLTGCVGWLLFRQRELDVVGRAIAEPAGSEPGHQAVVAVALLGVTALCAAPLVLALIAQRTIGDRLAASPWRLPLQTTGLAVAVVAIWFFARESGNDFIYFQF